MAKRSLVSPRPSDSLRFYGRQKFFEEAFPGDISPFVESPYQSEQWREVRADDVDGGGNARFVADFKFDPPLLRRSKMLVEKLYRFWEEDDEDDPGDMLTTDDEADTYDYDTMEQTGFLGGASEDGEFTEEYLRLIAESTVSSGASSALLLPPAALRRNIPSVAPDSAEGEAAKLSESVSSSLSLAESYLMKRRKLSGGWAQPSPTPSLGSSVDSDGSVGSW